MTKSSLSTGPIFNSDSNIRLRDGRLISISLHKPFSIKSDSDTHYWDFTWLNTDTAWCILMLDNLQRLLRTHSIQYAHNVAYKAKALFNAPMFKTSNTLTLDGIGQATAVVPMSYWPFLQPLLKRMAKQDTVGSISEDLKRFLNQPNRWEEKGKGAYFSLVTNDLTHGALTEQELYSIQEGVNSAYERGRINLEEYALVWFLIGTGVRPIQVARMKAGDIKIYDGPEGKEVTLYVPLAKGEATSDQGKWRRRCPTILAEILITYLNETKRKDSQSLFADQSVKISRSIKLIFDRVETYSERTEGPINIFPYRFRYTLGTRAIAQGGSDEEVARLLTHRNTFSVASYRAAMPHLQKPIKDALSGEMSLIATAFKGRLIKGLDDATRKGQVDALVRDFLHLNGEAVGACGTEAACHQHAPIACLTCQKFEPFSNSPWAELLDELQADMDSEDEDRIKLITLASIEAVKEIMRKCERRKAGTSK